MPAASLSPSHSAITLLRKSIQENLKTDLPPFTIATLISPFLAQVNLWSTQIPQMLDKPGPSTSANLVFAIRKDLFTGPSFNQCILGIPLNDLPIVFQAFLNFIHKLIEAQKGDKEKPIPKVENVLFLFTVFKHSPPFL